MKKKCKCDKKNCLLDFIFPHTDAGLACDSKCYFKHDGKKYLDWYIEHYPEQYKKFLEAINAPIV